jgi:hypothetical protein
LKAESRQTLRAVVPVCAGVAGGYLCFKLFYVAGIAWELHRYPGTNLAGLTELIVGIPVGGVSGFIILIATWIWMEPRGRRSIVPRRVLAVALALLAALMSFILIDAAYESHYYGKGGDGYGFFIGLMIGLFVGLLVFWLAWGRLKRA